MEAKLTTLLLLEASFIPLPLPETTVPWTGHASGTSPSALVLQAPCPLPAKLASGQTLLCGSCLGKGPRPSPIPGRVTWRSRRPRRRGQGCSQRRLSKTAAWRTPPVRCQRPGRGSAEGKRAGEGAAGDHSRPRTPRSHRRPPTADPHVVRCLRAQGTGEQQASGAPAPGQALSRVPAAHSVAMISFLS